MAFCKPFCRTDVTMIPPIPRPREAAAFAPFGTVIAFERMGTRRVNEGTAARANTAGSFEPADGLAPVHSLSRAEAQTLLDRAGTGLGDRRDRWHRPLLSIGAGGDRPMRTAEACPTDGTDHRLSLSFLVQDPVPYESTLHGA